MLPESQKGEEEEKVRMRNEMVSKDIIIIKCRRRIVTPCGANVDGG